MGLPLPDKPNPINQLGPRLVHLKMSNIISNMMQSKYSHVIMQEKLRLILSMLIVFYIISLGTESLNKGLILWDSSKD